MGTTDLLLASASKHMYQNYRQPPLVLVRGRGSEVWDETGKRYVDLYGGIAVNALGHAHPRLVEAIATQAGKLIHTSNYFFNEPNVRLAERLCALTGMQRAFFCNSGTEANEALLKLARRHFWARDDKEKYRVVAFEQSFHGRTLGALAATGQPGYREGFGPLPGVTHVPYGDAGAVRAALGPDVAAILVEPVQGEGGVLPAPEGFLVELRAIADEHGVLLLVDEIQTGIGRTGRFLACQHDAVVPDALTLAKALGGGVPIGAMLCRGHLADVLPPGSHGSTFGGNPLACAAALAVLDALEAEKLIEAAAQKGEHLSARLGELVRRHGRSVEQARGRGLLQALVLKEAIDARDVLARLREAGLLLTIAGGRALRFSPALTVEVERIDEGIGILDRVLGDLP